MSASTFFRRARKKVLKRMCARAFFPGMRPIYLRWCGFAIGEHVYIGDGLTIVEELADVDNLRIGDRVSIATNVTIVTSSHPNESRIRPVAPVRRAPVIIEDDAWIGAGAVLLPGAHIGRGAVVGALAVVSGEVAALQVMAGRPAAAIRTLDTPPGWT